MVVDNVRFHHAKLLKKWLINNTKLELVYLPPYSPELNPIERAWWYMMNYVRVCLKLIIRLYISKLFGTTANTLTLKKGAACMRNECV
jgi:transposase